MKTTALEFWSDETGFIISAELVLVATILVLGMIVGLSSVQGAIVWQLNSVARAFASLNQSYFIPGFSGLGGLGGIGGFGGCKASFAGSSFISNNFNQVGFVTTTCGFGAGGYGGSYGGFMDSSLGIGPATSAPAPAPRTADCPPGSHCPTDDCPSGDCPPGATTLPAPSGALPMNPLLTVPPRSTF